MDKVISNINEEIEIGEGSTTVRIPETNNEEVVSLNTKEKSVSSVTTYARSKAGNKNFTIRKTGNLIEILVNYDIFTKLIVIIFIEKFISGGKNIK